MSKRNYLLPFMLWCFFLLGLTACSGVFSATPTPPPMPDTVVSTPAPLQGAVGSAPWSGAGVLTTVSGMGGGGEVAKKKPEQAVSPSRKKHQSMKGSR